MRPRWVSCVVAMALLTAIGIGTLHAETRPVKEWTILVYLAADNDLAPFGLDDINEMEVVGSSDEVNIVVQWDGSHQYSPGFGGSARYYIERDDCMETISSPIIEDLGEVDMGCRQTLIDFLEWGLTEFPAKRTFLVMWNHGNGWYQDIETSPLDFTSPHDVQELVEAVEVIQGGGRAELERIVYARRIRELMRIHTAIRPFGSSAGRRRRTEGPSRLIAYDEGGDEMTALSTTDVREALEAVSHLLPDGRMEFVGFDACLMGMVEVMHELRDVARWSIASQKVEPGGGWAYDWFLAPLIADPYMDTLTLGQVIIDTYTERYAQWNEQVPNPFHKVNGTLAMVDLDEIGALTTALENLGSALAARPELRQSVWRATIETQHCGEIARIEPTVLLMHTAHRDVEHFAENIKRFIDDPAIHALADEVILASQMAVKYFRLLEGTPLMGVPNATGLAVFIPFLQLDPTYADLHMGQGPWAEFLDWFKSTPAEAQQLIAIMTGAGQREAEEAEQAQQGRFDELHGYAQEQ